MGTLQRQEAADKLQDQRMVVVADTALEQGMVLVRDKNRMPPDRILWDSSYSLGRPAGADICFG